MAKISREERDIFTKAYRFYEKHRLKEPIDLDAAASEYEQYLLGNPPRLGVFLMGDALDELGRIVSEKEGESEQDQGLPPQKNV